MTTPKNEIGNDVGWCERDGVRFSFRVLRRSSEAFLPTLFVSGAFQTMDSWSRFSKAFGEETSVILVDPPGMGLSDVLPPEHGADFLAGCMHQLIDHCGLPQVNVVAASYGTPAAHRLAQLHPERINRIALVRTMREIPAHLRDRIRATVDLALDGERSELARRIVDGLLCRDESVEVERRVLAERVLARSITGMSDTALHQYATNTLRLLTHEPIDDSTPIDGPEALVFTGEHDCFTVPDACREIAQAFRRSWFTVVKRADHLAHVERFDVVVDLLLRFMRGTLDQGPAGWAPIEWAGEAEAHPDQAVGALT